jgi:hypothetical protein
MMFSPFAAAYSKGVNNLIYKWKNLISMHKGDFYGLFIDAWNTTFTEKNILKAFEATGLFPFDRSTSPEVEIPIAITFSLVLSIYREAAEASSAQSPRSGR